MRKLEVRVQSFAHSGSSNNGRTVVQTQINKISGVSPMNAPACLAVVHVEMVSTGLGKEVGARSQPQILSLKEGVETSLVAQKLRFHAPNAGDLGSISVHGARFYMQKV